MFPAARHACSRLLSTLGIIAALAMLLSCGGGGEGAAPDASAAPTPGLSLLAGNIGGPGHIDAVGTDARFELLGETIAADRGGNVYVMDNSLLRKIARDGSVTTLAGNRVPALPANVDGKGSEARFADIGAMTTDAAGNVYMIAERFDAPPVGLIRKVTPDGTVTTLPNSDKLVVFTRLPNRFPTFSGPATIAVDSAGTVYVAGNSIAGNSVSTMTATGEVTQLAETADALAVDSDDNLYMADYTNHNVRKRTPGGVTTTVTDDPRIKLAGGSSRPSITAVGNRLLYVNVGFGVLKVGLVGFSAASLPIGNERQAGVVDGQGSAARLRGAPIAADGDGNVFQIGDLTVRKITPGGSVFTLAGAGPLLSGDADTVGSAARFNSPVDLATDAKGTLYLADAGITSLIRKIDPAGRVTTFVGNPAQGGSDDGIGAQATFQDPSSLAIGPSGTIYVLQSNHRLRKISAGGVVTTTILPAKFAVSCATDFVVDAQENLYFSCAVLIKISPFGAISAPWNPGVDLGPTGPLSGALASVSAASNTIYHQPRHLAIDTDGNLYGTTDDTSDPILKFREDGLVEAIPNSQSTNVRTGIAVDPEGTIYVSEQAPRGSGADPAGFIRRITPAGPVTIAGTPGIHGTLLGPLPGAIDQPRGLRFIAPKTLAVAVTAGVLKVVVP
jgi:sugar lactone lactonase YvrE